MKEEAKHHSQVSAQSTIPNEISVVPPNNNNGSLELQLWSPPQQYHPDIVQPTTPSATTQVHLSTTQMSPPHVDEQALQDALRQKWFEDRRGWIMVVAVLVASVTYTTGLSPPGGFWQEDKGDLKAGSSILRDKLPHRYTTFFYANATAFMASLVIIVLIMNEKVYCDQKKVVTLNIIMVLDLVSLMIAYAAGCARSLKTSIYVILLVFGVLLMIVLYSARFWMYICSIDQRRRTPSVHDVGGRDFILDRPRSSSQTRERDMTQSSI